MRKLIAWLCGPLRRVHAASRHALWYLDWHTGGSAARDSTMVRRTAG